MQKSSELKLISKKMVLNLSDNHFNNYVLKNQTHGEITIESY